MISIQKSSKIPSSLVLPIEEIKKGKTKITEETKNGKTTHQRRMELIDEKGYIDTTQHNRRYKMDDTKLALKTLYHSKCCYCEQRVEAGHVEHYRPKSLYWWLAYSWDNLLYICPTCNINKSNCFEISNEKATYEADNYLENIHKLCAIYNEKEKPSLLNPEQDNFENMWTFNKEGQMFSENCRGKYTIERLELDRTYLNDERKTIFDDFENDILEQYFLYENRSEILFEQLSLQVEKFVKKSQKPKNTFLAFRQYAIHTLVNDLILEIYS
ncbi:MAG: hypothetical protein RLZZ292_790 [Bacteroidota bacterium]|jgi:uncharacterized protein (TIGR02646 family)